MGKMLAAYAVPVMQAIAKQTAYNTKSEYIQALLVIYG